MDILYALLVKQIPILLESTLKTKVGAIKTKAGGYQSPAFLWYLPNLSGHGLSKSMLFK